MPDFVDALDDARADEIGDDVTMMTRGYPPRLWTMLLASGGQWHESQLPRA